MSVAPYGGSTDQSQSLTLPIMPSADALTYELNLAYYSDAGTFAVTVDHSDDGTLWTNAGINGQTIVSSGGVDNLLWASTFTLPAASRYLKITATHNSSVNDVQLHWVCVRPARNLPATTTTAGFVSFDDALHSGTTGGPVYVELLNRCRDNVLAVMRDRYQSLGGWAQQTGRPTQFRVSTTMQLFRMPYFLPGQHNATVNVRVYGEPGRGSSGRFIVGQVLGGENSFVTLAMDSTHRSGTITLQGAEGEIYGAIEVTTGSALIPHYVCLDWRPGD